MYKDWCATDGKKTSKAGFAFSHANYRFVKKAGAATYKKAIAAGTETEYVPPPIIIDELGDEEIPLVQSRLPAWCSYLPVKVLKMKTSRKTKKSVIVMTKIPIIMNQAMMMSMSYHP